LLIWFQVLVYAAEPDQPQAASAASTVQAEPVTSLSTEWTVAHTTVRIDDKYEWLVAVIMTLVVLYALEEENHKRKKKRRK
jgi:hypothetical protein